MKNIVKLFSMFMIMVGTFAFGQTGKGAMHNMKQASMQGLAEVTQQFYDKDVNQFISNIEKHDGLSLTRYETRLLQEVHQNITKGSKFGSYTVNVLSDFKSYDRTTEYNQSTTAKPPSKKQVCGIIRIAITALEALCAFLC